MGVCDNEGGLGTLLVAQRDAPLSMACHHFSAEDVDAHPESTRPRTRHASELVERQVTYVTVDGAQAGVGGIDSWGSLPLSQHRLMLHEPCSWAFVVRPYAEGDLPAAALAASLRSTL